MSAAYITYAPDLAMPGARDAIRVLVDLSRAAGREMKYVDIPHDAFVSEVAGSGAPEEVVWMLDYLFATVLDGRNAHLTDGVQRALGRPPRDFADYAREVAATGIWRKAA